MTVKNLFSVAALKNRLGLNEIFRAGSNQVNSGLGERRTPTPACS
jgi:hypothetical protein